MKCEFYYKMDEIKKNNNQPKANQAQPKAKEKQ